MFTMEKPCWPLRYNLFLALAEVSVEEDTLVKVELNIIAGTHVR
jgi:hypothetical protein